MTVFFPVLTVLFLVFVVSISPPSITVNNADSNNHINTQDASYKLMGSISGNSTVKINGNQVKLDNGNFTYPVTLKMGTNTEHIAASNKNGETDEDVTITLSKASVPSKSTSPSPSPKATPKASTAAKTVDVSKVKASLTKEETYTVNWFNQGKAALGTYQYPDEQSAEAAFNDPNSPASVWSKYNSSFGDTQATVEKNETLANNDAVNAYYGTKITPPSVINDLSLFDGTIENDIYTWKTDATSWQIGGSTSNLNADEQKVQQDFAQAQAMIAKL